jgi:hypothetical protein
VIEKAESALAFGSAGMFYAIAVVVFGAPTWLAIIIAVAGLFAVRALYRWRSY